MTRVFSEAALHALLGRTPHAGLSAEDRGACAGRRVLITGAGGSIGSALAREVAACAPARLVLFDHSEYALFHIERDLRRRYPAVTIEPVLGDVTRAAHVRRVFARTPPDVVYHAAACKHVTMAERAVAFAADVNVLGTAIVVAAAAEAGARFVLISSDKAAAPEAVMGATKRFAELVTLARADATFRPRVVRFGNVLGSSGSLLEIMTASVRDGQPIPVTDPDATRYFMTPAEAVSLVIRAERQADGPGIFWLDMGDPIRIGDLVERFLLAERIAGRASAGTTVVGLRPGEKMHEQLADPHLTFEVTGDSRIWRARETAIARPAIDRAIRRLQQAVDRADDGLALRVIAGVVAGYHPTAQARLDAGWTDTDTAAVPRPRPTRPRAWRAA